MFGNMNMQDLMGQMQQMQEKLKEQQDAVLKLEVVGEAGAGLVSVRMNGKRDVLAVHMTIVCTAKIRRSCRICSKAR